MSGCICRTTDGGATWEDQNVPTQSYLWSIRFPAGTQTGFCCGEGVMLTTTDGGVTWIANPNLTSQDLWSMQFPVSAGTGYIVGSGGTILKTGYGGGIAETMNDERRTVNVGPTIVRGVLQLAIDECRVSNAELLDAAGRKVMELRGGANDVSRLAPGVYFVSQRRTMNEEPKTLKIVIQD